MKKILITGGCGFLGYHLAKNLLKEKNNYIILVDNFFRGKNDKEISNLLKTHKKNVKLLTLDLSLKEELEKIKEKCDQVYHLAAVNGTNNFYKIPHTVLKTNLLSTINILEWFLKNKVDNNSKIILASSSEVYAGIALAFKKTFPFPTPESVPLGIENIKNPRWSYAGSKIINELLFQNYATIFNIRMSIIRYYNVYGPRMGYGHVIPHFFVRILKKENPFQIFGSKSTRSFCYIDDAIEGTKRIMNLKNTDNEVINVGNNKEISIMTLAKKIFYLTNYIPQAIQINPPPEGDVFRRKPNLSKAKSLVNYNPKISLENGLKKTWNWYKQQQ